MLRISTKPLLGNNKKLSERLIRRLPIRRAGGVMSRQETQLNNPRTSLLLNHLLVSPSGAPGEISPNETISIRPVSSEPEPASEFPTGILARVRQALAEYPSSSPVRPSTRSSWPASSSPVTRQQDQPLTSPSQPELHSSLAEPPSGQIPLAPTATAEAQQRIPPSPARPSRSNIEELSLKPSSAREVKPRSVASLRLEPEPVADQAPDRFVSLESAAHEPELAPSEPTPMPTSLVETPLSPRPSVPVQEAIIAAEQPVIQSPSPSSSPIQRVKQNEGQPEPETATPVLLVQPIHSAGELQPPIQSIEPTQMAGAAPSQEANEPGMSQVTTGNKSDSVPQGPTTAPISPMDEPAQLQPAPPSVPQPTLVSRQPASLTASGEPILPTSWETPASLENSSMQTDATTISVREWSTQGASDREPTGSNEPTSTTPQTEQQVAVPWSEDLIQPPASIPDHPAASPTPKKPETPTVTLAIGSAPALSRLTVPQLPQELSHPTQMSPVVQREPALPARGEAQPIRLATATPTRLSDRPALTSETVDMPLGITTTTTEPRGPKAQPETETVIIQRAPLIQPRPAPAADPLEPNTTIASAAGNPGPVSSGVTTSVERTPAIDLEQITDQVYQRLCRRLRIEQERARGSMIS